VTEHAIQIGGERVAYTATAGYLIVKNAEEKPAAQFGYTAYVRDGLLGGRDEVRSVLEPWRASRVLEQLPLHSQLSDAAQTAHTLACGVHCRIA
jgi:hypothetical protein